MINTTYTLPPLLTVLTHTDHNVMAVHDAAQERQGELDIHIKSGDYFVTLATKLDLISQTLPFASERENLFLQQLVDDLLYLQQRYKIIEKDKRRFPFA